MSRFNFNLRRRNNREQQHTGFEVTPFQANRTTDINNAYFERPVTPIASHTQHNRFNGTTSTNTDAREPNTQSTPVLNQGVGTLNSNNQTEEAEINLSTPPATEGSPATVNRQEQMKQLLRVLQTYLNQGTQSTRELASRAQTSLNNLLVPNLEAVSRELQNTYNMIDNLGRYATANTRGLRPAISATAAGIAGGAMAELKPVKALFTAATAFAIAISAHNVDQRASYSEQSEPAAAAIAGFIGAALSQSFKEGYPAAAVGLAVATGLQLFTEAPIEATAFLLNALNTGSVANTIAHQDDNLQVASLTLGWIVVSALISNMSINSPHGL